MEGGQPGEGMIIQCTKKLQNRMKASGKCLIYVGKTEYPHGLSDWHGTLLERDGNEWVVLMNNLTGYPVVFPVSETLKETDFRDAIFEQLRKEGFHEQLLSALDEWSGPVYLEKVSSRAAIQRLNQVVKRVLELPDEVWMGVTMSDGMAGKDRVRRDETVPGRIAARRRMHFEEGYLTPAERLFVFLERWGEAHGLPVYHWRAFVLSVSCGKEMEAEILVPENLPFLFLNELLTRVFGREFQSDEGAECRWIRKYECQQQRRPGAWALRISGVHPVRKHRFSLREVNREIAWIVEEYR